MNGASCREDRIRVGTLALALNAMGDKFRTMIDVTIVYPPVTRTFWQFLCGRTPKVIVRAR